MFRALAFRCANDPQDAEDAVQDALLSAWRHLGSFRGSASMATWLYTIVLNTTRMQRRRTQTLKRRGLHLPIEELAAVIPVGTRTAEEQLLGDELHMQLRQAILRLSPVQRESFLMYADEATIIETASKLDIPIGTVKARRSRARRTLQRQLSRRAIVRQSRA